MHIKYLLVADNGTAKEVEMDRRCRPEAYGVMEDNFLAESGAKERFARWIRWPVQSDDYANGVPFTWGLAGSSGAAFTLIALPGTDATRIKHAKTWLRDRRDVVSIEVLRINKIIPCPSQN
jgi:hypothetical protein